MYESSGIDCLKMLRSTGGEVTHKYTHVDYRKALILMYTTINEAK